jgi:phospholipase C
VDVSPTVTTEYTLVATGPGGSSNPAKTTVLVDAGQGQGIKLLNHIIIFLQENRSFDTYFGKLGEYREKNGYGPASEIDGLPANAANDTEDKLRELPGFTIPAYKFQTMCMENTSPDWLESHAQANVWNPGLTNYPIDFLGNGWLKSAQGDVEFLGRVFDTSGRLLWNLPTSGTVVVAPRTTTNYYLFADRSGVPLAYQTVYVDAPFTASPPNLAPGGSSTLIWNIPNATSVTVWRGITPVGNSSGPSGSVMVTPGVAGGSNATYAALATLTDGSMANYSVVVTVNPPTGATLTVTSNIITNGTSVAFTWDIQNLNPEYRRFFAPGAPTTAMISNIYDRMGVRAIGYFDDTDLPYQYFMAANFATSNRFFSPVMAASEPNRMYMFAATTRGHVHDPGSYCSQQSACPGQPVVKNIFQLLEEKGISWKVYYQDFNKNNGRPSTRMDRFQPFRDQHAGKIVLIDEYYRDLQNGTLPQVVFIEELAGLDEHPGGTLSGDVHSGNHLQAGARLAAKIINSLMTSQFWRDSVFFLAFDEGGGVYDHVPPQPAVHPDGIKPLDLEQKDIDFILPQSDFVKTGYRIPMMVISPYARRRYVSNTVMDFTAILKFIETRFELPNLTERDRAQPRMDLEFFDFASPPWMTPPTPPEQPVNKPCDYTDLPKPWLQ